MKIFPLSNAGRITALLQPCTRLAVGAALALSASAFAGEASRKEVIQTSSVWEKPAWLTDLSLGVRESYDTNVYVAGSGVPPTVAGVDNAITNKSSWATTITPKIGVDFAKLLGSDSAIKLFTLGYSPDIVKFSEASSEDYVSHRLTTGLKVKMSNVTFNLDNAFTFIDGSSEGLVYPGGSSSFCNSTVRERRDQWQERTKANVQVDFGSLFIRPTISVLYYDLGTVFHTTATNYTNYTDRYDINGGADLGYKVTQSLAFTAGYRYGRQYQEAWPDDVSRTVSTNDYHRILFGIEGSPVKWLKIEGLVGPQFTTFTDQRPTGITDKSPEDVYAEASATITPTKSDALVIKYKRWNWVSSTGKNIYLETCYDASLRHQITKDLQLQLGFRAFQADYNPSSARNDWLYTTSAGLRYAVNKNVTLELTYAYDRGENEQEAISNPAYREFERSIVSTGVQWAF